jgi:hypothetical protein
VKNCDIKRKDKKKRKSRRRRELSNEILITTRLKASYMKTYSFNALKEKKKKWRFLPYSCSLSKTVFI